MNQIFGYKLSAEDGSESPWVFINDPRDRLDIAIRLMNGSTHRYERDGKSVLQWASPRELDVQYCVFDFDPVTISFTRHA